MWDSVGKLLKRLNTRLKKPKKKKKRKDQIHTMDNRKKYIYIHK